MTAQHTFDLRGKQRRDRLTQGSGQRVGGGERLRELVVCRQRLVARRERPVQQLVGDRDGHRGDAEHDPGLLELAHVQHPGRGIGLELGVDRRPVASRGQPREAGGIARRGDLLESIRAANVIVVFVSQHR